MISIEIPFKSWGNKRCSKCHNNILNKKIPRLYLFGFGYICKDCAIAIAEEYKITIINYNKLLDTPEYAKLLVADNL